MIMGCESEVGATRVLRAAVWSAYEHVLRRGCDLATVNEALAELFVAVVPEWERLMLIAVALPAGSTVAVLEHLRWAFDHAARGLPGPAVVSLMAAAALRFHLVDDEVLDAEYVRRGRETAPTRPPTPLWSHA